MNNKEIENWIKNNRGLIWSLILRYGLKGHTQIEFNELYNQAILKVYDAGRYYRKGYNTKFSSYVSLCIARELFRHQRKNLLKLSYPYRVLDIKDNYLEQKKKETETVIMVDNLSIIDNLAPKVNPIDELDKELDMQRFSKIIDRVLVTMSERDERVIRDIYDLKTFKRKKENTLTKLADKYGVTIQNIYLINERFIRMFTRILDTYKIERLQEDY